MSADFSPAFSAWVDALEYVNDLTTKEILCMNEAWDAALEWERCRRIDEHRKQRNAVSVHPIMAAALAPFAPPSSTPNTDE